MATSFKTTEINDKQAVREVIGGLLHNPALVKEYKMVKNDFAETFHKLIFSAIYNLYKNGAKEIDSVVIDDYLSQFNTQYKKFTDNNGIEFLDSCYEMCNTDNFKYYYDRLKKFSLLREYYKNGIDISEFFDALEVNPEIVEEKADLLDRSTLIDIVNHYKKKQLQITAPFIISDSRQSKKAGVGGIEQLEKWKEATAWGLGYASAYLTTILHGLRGRRFTVKSAGTGVGKTRSSISDLCHACAPKYYNKKLEKWCINPNGTNNGGLYIGTEMELLEEIEPILWAYMADVPQEHIEFNMYEDGEEERVREAIRILEEEANIWLEYIPEYDASSLEEVIEKHKIEHNIKSVWFDYIHTTAELIGEYQSKSRARMMIREDMVLADLSNKLKIICRKLNVSLETCTQVSGDFKNEDNRDSTIVRGAKSIIDKADSALIAMPPTEKELKKIEGILRRMIGKPKPNLCYSVYKNRGGKFNKVKIWLYVDYDTMRVHDLFCTDYNYNLIDVPKTYINVENEQFALNEPFTFTVDGTAVNTTDTVHIDKEFLNTYEQKEKDRKERDKETYEEETKRIIHHIVMDDDETDVEY